MRRARLIREIDLETSITQLERYRFYGKLHRDPKEGPAYIERSLRDGRVYRKRYYWHGHLHREDGPAWLEYDTENTAILERYYRHGLVHRDPKEGPAWIERAADGVLIREGYFWYGRGYRDPADGAYATQRVPSGRVEFERFSDPGERPPTRATRRRKSDEPAP
jgi:hypothetical protein